MDLFRSRIWLILLVNILRCTSSRAQSQHTLIAPQIIREGVEEYIVLNLHGVDGKVSVTASLHLDGVRNFEFNDVDATKPIKMDVRYDKPPGAEESNKIQYVELIVVASQGGKKIYDRSLKMRMIESSGYIHVQTDRPIYRPEEVVKIRVIALNQKQGPDLDREVEIVIRIPPDNVGVEKRLMRMPENKFIETSFELPEFPTYGVWSIVARFTDEKQVKWSEIKFSVRPYVLPTFNVDLSLEKPFVLVKEDMSEEYIKGSISSRYSYGKTVSGSYFLVAKLKRPGFEKPTMFYQLPEALNKQAKISGGKRAFKVKATKILEVLQEGEGFRTLLEEQATITIEASVTGGADGVIESDISAPIVFVVSPYKTDISRMSKYYTPGISFEMKVDVLDSVTEKPVSGVEVLLSGPGEEELFVVRSNDDGQINEKINMDAVANKKQYTLMTRDPQVPAENEAKVDFTLHPYTSASGSVLQLSAGSKIAEVGERIGIDAWFQQAPSQIRYVILSRGSIVGEGVHSPKENSRQTNFKIEITGDMVPSFRIFAYYFINAEIVSNSLWVDVRDACKKEIQVVVPDAVLPGAHLNVEYTGSPHAIIGMSAVDRAAYFLYGESRLTREIALGKLDQYDEGCVREGGKNAQHVFEEGGLQIVGGPYGMKADFTNHCQSNRRRRRKRGVPNDVKAKLEEDEELRRCAFDAALDNLADETCDERAKRVLQYKGQDCADVFSETCHSQTRLKPSGGRAANGNAGGFKALGASAARSNFEESMLWQTQRLDGNGKYKQLVIARDSITTFEFDTVSMHETDGFCVAKTQNMTIFKNIFIQLKLPYSLKLGEQVEIRASVFNYGDRSKEITIRVKMGEHICSHFPKGEFTDLVTLEVGANSAETTSFVMLPLRIPENKMVELEVKAYDAGNRRDLDHIKKSILVEPEGQIKDIKGTRAIDLKNKGPGAIQQLSIEFRFPEKYLAGSRRCWLYPYSNFMGPIIQFDPVTKQPKNDIKNIIRMPRGCGEQTMLSMGPNVYAHRYLKSVRKMPDGSPEEQGSIDKMKSGFANQLKYRSSKYNVWAVFPHSEPSVWLNAYVNKVFAQAKQFYVDMDVTPICNSIDWMLTKQEGDGGFSSGGRVIHREMHGAVASKLSLSAYVLISLVESRSLCPALGEKVNLAIYKTIKYLENNENDPTMDQPYTLSLVTYAMSMSDSSNAFGERIQNKLLGKIIFSEDNQLAYWKGAPLQQIQGTDTHSYWYTRKPLAIDVEATGHALLAMIRGHEAVKHVSQGLMDITRKIVLWLIEQRDENGGFSTTQDTVVGLQALSAYMIWSSIADSPSNEVQIDLTLKGTNGTEWFEEPKRIHLDKRNENLTVPVELPSGVISSGRLQVMAEGIGEASISYRCIYRTLVEEDSCHFNIKVSTEEQKMVVVPGQAKRVIIKVNLVISKPKGLPSGQSIVEVNLISGYEPIEDTLQKLSRTYIVDGSIERYEIAKQKVILYLGEITAEKIKLSFLLNQVVPVDKSEPSSVTVYDYYEPTVKCTKFYGLPNDMTKLRTTCKDENVAGGEDICKCAEGGCLKCRTRDMQLKKTSCLPGMNEKCKICSDPSQCYNMTQVACKSNYVYEIKIINGTKEDSGVFVEFDAEILTVYKKGSDFTARDKDQVRPFTTRNDCYASCRDPGLADPDKAENDAEQDFVIKEGRTLLIMGNLVELNQDKVGHSSARYRMDESTIIERIIPEEKCKTAHTKAGSKKCKKITEKSKPKVIKSCEKAAAMNQSCRNLQLLRRILIKGCDNIAS